ncbi:uncharacterized protein BDW47DRAFT_67875 [Aspergillus candidus]|uniref:Uncharacterized protein n=1 Tax=Aspergillus candidus TaxID=41067 RepID=A0A2I2F3G9_ASPCN|nr:hypothetical protein BDW47DRAFT_67875 [Aspergillus candidus]PLB35185.1 hypothetical protein BDW47DRAFT_67875 [Aspergillus candidus]
MSGGDLAACTRQLRFPDFGFPLYLQFLWLLSVGRWRCSCQCLSSLQSPPPDGAKGLFLSNPPLVGVRSWSDRFNPAPQPGHLFLSQGSIA